MQKHLYFLCPTDCLESVINNTFKHENYFYTSLGNSFVAENKTIESLSEVIIEHNIKEISFVLSNNNHIINDALGAQDFLRIKGLTRLYRQIKKQKEHSDMLWKTDYNQFIILSYYLNKKINELQLQLANLSKRHIKIGGKIYNKHTNSFTNIYADLICLQKHHLN
ncbi:hypothetical protein [Tenacibaculum ovolyticum]|uniref:hypothetical protein n=1 Tax=Tenacibaculum ovolyticum TaxID=104270 RepID=UPI003BA967F9